MSQLGSYFVEFAAKGAKDLLGSVDTVGKAMSKLADVGKKMGEVFASSFKLAATSVTALAAAGLVGTVEGNRMAFAWQQLARQISAVALPVFQAITRVVERLTDWFRNLSGAQQNQLLRWALIAGAIGGVVLAASGLGVIPGLLLASTSAAALFATHMDDAASSAKEVVKQMIELAHYGGIAATVVGIVAKSPTLAIGGTLAAISPEVIGKLARDAGKALDAAKGGGGRRDVTQAPRGFEAITSSYSRIQTSITQTDRPATSKDVKDASLSVITVLTALGFVIKSAAPAVGS